MYEAVKATHAELRNDDIVGLTVKQPHAWLIAHAHKKVECRSWPLPDGFLGKRLAIHAGQSLAKRYDQIADEWWSDSKVRIPDRREIERSAVVATCTLAGCAGYDKDYKWFLSDVIRLNEPIPCKGTLNLWRLPPELRAELIR